MSILLKVDVTNPQPDLTLSPDSWTVTQQNTEYVFKKKWHEGDSDKRFEVNENDDPKTVTDHKTGLVWLKDANAFGYMNWYDAVKKVDELNGNQNFEKGKWRLPTLAELLNLCYDDSGNFRRPDAPFINIHSGYYCSSSGNSDPTSDKWHVDLEHGSVLYNVKLNNHFVWPVRGGQ